MLACFTPNTFNNTNQWAPLPYEFTEVTGAFTYNVVFETMPDTVRLQNYAAVSKFTGLSAAR